MAQANYYVFDLGTESKGTDSSNPNAQYTLHPEVDISIPFKQMETGPKKTPRFTRQEGDIEKYTRQEFEGILSTTYGLGENAFHLTSALFAALPGMAFGIYDSIKEKDINKYSEVFHEIQDAATFEPKTEKGKVIKNKLLNTAFEALDKFNTGVASGIAESEEEQLVKLGMPREEARKKAAMTYAIEQVKMNALELFAPMSRTQGLRGSTSPSEPPSGGGGATPLEGQLIRPGEQAPRDPLLEVQPKPPIEGEATRISDAQLPDLEYEGPGRTDYGKYPEGFIRKRQQQLGEERARKEVSELPISELKTIPLTKAKEAPYTIYDLEGPVSKKALPASEKPKMIESKYQDFLDKAGKDFIMEEKGHQILSDMESANTSPKDVSTKFWTETYFNLPAKVQGRFEGMLKRLTGMSPGSVVAKDTKTGKTISAKDWQDVAKEIDLPTTVEGLEGTERGLVVLMQEANDRFGSKADVVDSAVIERKRLAKETEKSVEVEELPVEEIEVGRTESADIIPFKDKQIQQHEKLIQDADSYLSDLKDQRAKAESPEMANAIQNTIDKIEEIKSKALQNIYEKEISTEARNLGNAVDFDKPSAEIIPFDPTVGPKKGNGGLPADMDPHLYSFPGVNYERIIGQLNKAWEAWDTSSVAREVRGITYPSHSGSPKGAAFAKDFANEIEVINNELMLRNRSIDNLFKTRTGYNRERNALAYEAGEDVALRNSLTPDERAAVESLVADAHETSVALLQRGLVKGIRYPYFKRLVEDYIRTPKNQKMFKEGFIPSKIYTGARKYETIAAGEAEGIKYVKDLKVVSEAIAYNKRVILTHDMVKTLKRISTDENMPLIADAGAVDPNSGYVIINHPAFRERTYINKRYVPHDGTRYYFKGNEVEINGKTYPVTKNRTTGNKEVYVDGKLREVKETTETYDQYMEVHPDIATPLKTLLEANNPNIALRALAKIKAGSIQMIMYSPMFHNVTVFFKMGPSVPKEMHWNPKEVFGADVYDALSPAAKIASHSWFGPYLVGKYLRSNNSLVNESIRDNVRYLGGRGYQREVYGEIFSLRKNILHNISNGLGDAATRFGDFWHGTLLWDRIADAQMGLWYIHKRKFTKQIIEQKEKELGRPLTEQEVNMAGQDAGKIAGDYANILVGALGKEDLGKGFRHFLNATLFSTSYQTTNIRMAKIGAGITPKYVQGQARLLSPKEASEFYNGTGWKLLAVDLFLFFGTLQGLNYLFTKYNNIPDKEGKSGGHFTWDNEPGKEWHIATYKDERGTVRYVQSPFRATRDTVEIFAKPSTIIPNKISPTTRMVVDFLKGTDWQGKQIVPPGHKGVEAIADHIKHAFSTYTGAENLLKTYDPEVGSEINYFRALGIQTSRGAGGGQQIGALLDMKRQVDANKFSIYKDAVDLISHNKESEAIDLLINEGFTPESIQNFLMNYHQPYAYKLLNLNWKDMYRHATPEQRKELDKVSPYSGGQ